MTERWQPVPTPPGPDPVGDDGRVAIFHRLMDDFALCHGDVPDETRRHMAMLAAASVRALLSELAALKDIAGLPADVRLDPSPRSVSSGESSEPSPSAEQKPIDLMDALRRALPREGKDRSR